MPGDGIGKAVLEETIRLLKASGFEAEYVEADIGWEFWCKRRKSSSRKNYSPSGRT